MSWAGLMMTYGLWGLLPILLVYLVILDKQRKRKEPPPSPDEDVATHPPLASPHGDK